jgi:hypothetical protein
MLARTAALGLRVAATHSRCACEATLTTIRPLGSGSLPRAGAPVASRKGVGLRTVHIPTGAGRRSQLVGFLADRRPGRCILLTPDTVSTRREPRMGKSSSRVLVAIRQNCRAASESANCWKSCRHCRLHLPPTAAGRGVGHAVAAEVSTPRCSSTLSLRPTSMQFGYGSRSAK